MRTTLRQHIVLIFFLLCMGYRVLAQGGGGKQVIYWDSVGQSATVLKCSNYKMIYGKVEPEDSYIEYTEDITDPDLITLRLRARPRIPPIKVTQGVCIPTGGGSPIAAAEIGSSDRRQVTFRALGQREKILNGECINVRYNNIDTQRTYLAYESTEDGYWIELSDLREPKRTHFAMRCQSFVVANPASTMVTYSHNVRYEQIIWTPRVDGSWELRLGSVQQGCRSEALEDLNKLRYDPDYKRNVPVMSTK